MAKRKRETNAEAHARGEQEERDDTLRHLRYRLRQMRSGKADPLDEEGHRIKHDNTMSINARKGAVGELVRLVAHLEQRNEETV